MATQNIYTCSFCGKTAEGKPISFLINPIDREKAKKGGCKVSLMPVGWDWDIAPIKFTDLFSCGCHKFR